MDFTIGMLSKNISNLSRSFRPITFVLARPTAKIIRKVSINPIPGMMKLSPIVERRLFTVGPKRLSIILKRTLMKKKVIIKGSVTSSPVINMFLILCFSVLTILLPLYFLFLLILIMFFKIYHISYIGKRGKIIRF